ncbi:MAG: glucosamine-6-phosphate deaminase [Rhodoglobus sp.]
MEVIITTEETIGQLVADQIVALLAEHPDSVLGLATGSSPLRVYDALAERASRGDVSFAQARGFTLDEYVGLPDGHPAQYCRVIEEEFVSRVDFAPGAVLGPDGTAADLAQASLDYERAMEEAGGIDLQILGVGTEGHIAFNEPGSSFASRTRAKTLMEQTRRDNARFFAGDIDAVPRHCLTQGLGTIMEARQIVLVATGENKATAIEQLVEGAVSALWPATILQHHPRVTVFLDNPAASKLQLVDYYRDIQTQRHLVQ